MKIAIAFIIGAWVGYSVCALMAVGKDNLYENNCGYDEKPIDGEA